jgi:hypothetical protein
LAKPLCAPPNPGLACYRLGIIGGKETPSSETDSVGFFGEAEIPALSLTRVTPAQIRRMFAHHRVPEMPTDFDHDA